MGLMSSVVTWPLAPVRAVMSLGEVIQRRVDEEMRDPASIRRQLEAAQDAYESGDISADELAQVEQQALDRTRGLPPENER